MRHIVFDLETTGFKFSEGHRIVEVGAVELVNGALTGRTFHVYIDPERDMPEEAYRVHGLSGEFLRGKPVFAHETAAPAFLDFIGDADLIAHNGIGFDLPFLQAELAAAGLPKISNELIDTLLLARRKFPGAPASLDALCSRFSIDTSERERDGHGALLDSRLLAEVYIELTGGAQGGLDFAANTENSGQRRRKATVKAAKQRPAPLPDLATDSEKAAHAAFLDDIGEDCLWRKFAAG